MPSKPPAMLKSQPTNTCLGGEKKEKKQPREQSHATLGGGQGGGGFISDFTCGEGSQACTLPPQRSPDANAAILTWRVMDLECGTAWVSEFLSFDFTQYETQGLNLAWRSYRAPGVRLNSPCCELAVFFPPARTPRAGGVFSQMPPLQPDTLCISSAVIFSFLFLFSCKKKGTSQFSQLLLWIKELFCHCCWSNTVMQDHSGIFWQSLRGTGKKHGYRSLQTNRQEYVKGKEQWLGKIARVLITYCTHWS